MAPLSAAEPKRRGVSLDAILEPRYNSGAVVRSERIAGPPRTSSGHARPPRRAALVLLALTGVSCTSLLGIDGQYVVGLTDEGGTPSAGGGTGSVSPESGGGGGVVSGTGGATSTGGAGGATSMGGAGGTASGGATTSLVDASGCTVGGDTCPVGQKCCPALNGVDTFCTPPEPSVGCTLNACDRCPQPPPNGVAICNDSEQCDIRCNLNFTSSGGQCVPSGGSGGATGGSGGSSGTATCDPKKCPAAGQPGSKCTIASPFPCCKSDGSCGCTWATTGSSSAYCL